MNNIRSASIKMLAIAATLSMIVLPTAGAEPGDGGAVIEAPTLSFAQLGSSSYLALYGDMAEQTVTLAVPQGLAPAEMTATLSPPVNLRSATLTVTQDDRAIARVDLPVDRPGPVSIPLAGAEVVDNSMTLTLRTYLLPLEGYCLDPTNPLRLSDLALRYDGSEMAPRTVADFLPPTLRRLTIFLPAEPSRAESDTAVQLAAAIVARYGREYPVVAIAALPAGQTAPPAPSLPLERNMVVKEGSQPGLSLLGTVGVPALLISGPPAELTNQARLLASDLSRVAVSSAAVVGPLASTPRLPGDMTSLRELGQPGVNATSLSPRVEIGLDQTRLGRSAHNIGVHLTGSYTPLPSSVSGQIVASVGGETIDRWTAEGDGVIDRWVDIPDRLLQRYTTLAVEVDIAGNTGRCGEFQPLTLTIDGESAVRSSPAKPPVPSGFQSLPQALMPRVQVGIGADAFDDTGRAVAIVTALQRVSSMPIDTAVTSVQEALDSTNPAIVISADGWDHPDIELPVSGATDGPVTVNGFDNDGNNTTLTLEPSLQFGSLQTVFDGNRTLVVATSNGAAAQLDGLIDWLNADPDRWPRLSGAAILAPLNQAPVTVAGEPSDRAAPDHGNESGRLWWAVGGVALAALVIAAGLILLRAKRARRG